MIIRNKMQLRRSINSPIRFDEEELDRDGAEPATPPFPKMLQSTIVPFNPNARPAVFPSLDFKQRESRQVSFSSHGSHYINGILTLKIPSLRLVYNSSQLESHCKTSATVQGVVSNLPVGPSKPTAYHNHLTRHGKDTTDGLDINETVEGRILWQMMDLTIQVYIYSDLIIQLSSPEAVADWLGLQMCEIEAAHRFYQIRKIYPATTEQLWDYCVSANHLTDANYIDPELLAYFLDYFAFVSQYEFASEEQILLASAFLRQNHIDPSILEELLDGCTGLAEATNPNHTCNYPDDPWISKAFGESNCSSLNDDNGNLRLSPSFDMNSNESADKSLSSLQINSKLCYSILCCDMHKSKETSAKTFASHFTSRYFPADQRAQLLEHPPYLLTKLDHWLMYSAYRDTDLDGMFCFQDTAYTSMRALIALHNQYFRSLNNLSLTNMSRHAYIEALGCLWLYVIRRGTTATDLIWQRIRGLPVTTIQCKAYQVAAGTFERQTLCKIYDRIRLVLLESLQDEKKGNQHYETCDSESDVPSENYSYASEDTHCEDLSFTDTKASRLESHQSATPSNTSNLSKTFEDLGQDSCGVGIADANDVHFQRSYAPTEKRVRSETLSTNATLDMSGQSVRYRRVDQSIEHAKTVFTSQPLVRERDVTLPDGVHEALLPTKNIDMQRDSSVSGIIESQSSEELCSPSASSLSPVGIGCRENRVNKFLELDTRLQSHNFSHLHSTFTPGLKRQTPWKSNKDVSINDTLNKNRERQNGDREDRGETQDTFEDQNKIPTGPKVALNPESTQKRHRGEPQLKVMDDNVPIRVSTAAPPELTLPGGKTVREENHRPELTHGVSKADSIHGNTAELSKISHMQKKMKTPSPLIESIGTKTTLASLKTDEDSYKDSRKRKYADISSGGSTGNQSHEVLPPAQTKTPRKDKGKRRGPYMTKNVKKI